MAGLLDRWRKKQEKKKLSAVGKTTEVKVDRVKSGDTDQNKLDAEEKRIKKDDKTIKQRLDQAVGKKEKKKTTVQTEIKSGQLGGAYKVLVSPVVSEKAAGQEIMGQYTFVVYSNATKIQIKQAIKEIYNVMPEAVRIMNFEGKRKRFGRNRGKRKDWKKAVVTLPKGRTISIHEGV